MHLVSEYLHYNSITRQHRDSHSSETVYYQPLSGFDDNHQGSGGPVLLLPVNHFKPANSLSCFQGKDPDVPQLCLISGM